MSFYHVIIGLKSKPQKDAIAENLLEEDLMNNIVKPLGNHEKFRCGTDIVVPDDISSIKITASENFLHRGYSVSKERDYAELWQAINQQKDVTDKFIKRLPQRKKEPIKEAMPISKNVFIVHGRDHEPMKELKTMLYDFGLNPIVLHEQPSGSRTIVEKLEKYSDVGYAFAILTPDDVGGVKEDIFATSWNDYINARKPIPALEEEVLAYGMNDMQILVKLDEMFKKFFKYRARQNVVLEFGYFIGRLGRDRVCCLYKGYIELPSDMQGIVYIPFKASVNECRAKIIKELKAAGYEIKM